MVVSNKNEFLAHLSVFCVFSQLLKPIVSETIDFLTANFDDDEHNMDF